jgi:hypothetical protein
MGCRNVKTKRGTKSEVGSSLNAGIQKIEVNSGSLQLAYFRITMVAVALAPQPDAPPGVLLT